VIAPSEKDNLLQVTADKLKAQSDELLHEFTELAGTEQRRMESMAVKSHRLMELFASDYDAFATELEANVRTLAEFQKDFDKIDENFA